MRGIGALCCAVVAAQGAMGFMAPPLSTRALGRQMARASSSPSAAQPAPGRSSLRMVATEIPKFCVSLMDDTRVSFHMGKEDVRKLAAEVCINMYDRMGYHMMWRQREGNTATTDNKQEGVDTQFVDTSLSSRLSYLRSSLAILLYRYVQQQNSYIYVRYR